MPTGKVTPSIDASDEAPRTTQAALAVPPRTSTVLARSRSIWKGRRGTGLDWYQARARRDADDAYPQSKTPKLNNFLFR